ncbi:MAG TPA: hypothetical protein VLF91_01565 [Candidatus Saccharimonadales bacterium]|nr:hypothetical protein [Candidatus Saccharimonadales bacterium]
MNFDYDIDYQLPHTYERTSLADAYAEHVLAPRPATVATMDNAWEALRTSPNTRTLASFMLVAGAQAERAEAAVRYPDLVAGINWNADTEVASGRYVARYAREAFAEGGVGQLGHTVGSLLLGNAGQSPEPVRTALAADILRGRQDVFALYNAGAESDYHRFARASARNGLLGLLSVHMAEEFTGAAGELVWKGLHGARRSWPAIAYTEVVRAHGTEAAPLPIDMLRMDKAIAAWNNVPGDDTGLIPEVTKDVLRAVYHKYPQRAYFVEARFTRPAATSADPRMLY